MMPRPEKRIASDELSRVRQELKLACLQCGERHIYDVGTILHYGGAADDPADERFGFSKYFRCQECGGAGPWKIVNYLKMLGLALRRRVDNSYAGLVEGRCALFDGTFIQTPALGEEHLLKLLAKDPNNAFLCTRLGNVFRGCGERSRSVPWYEKALALDPDDIEARYHLYDFAVDDRDVAAALRHGPVLVRHLLEGRQADKDEVTVGIAHAVVETLRISPPKFRTEFLDNSASRPDKPERRFIRTLLDEEGDEEEIQNAAAHRLLNGEDEPPRSNKHLNEEIADPGDEGASLDLVPSLRSLVEAEGLNAGKLSVAVEASNEGQIRVTNRQLVTLFDGGKVAQWRVASLRELFRGNRPAPADIDRYPATHVPHFLCIEKHLLTVCNAQGDPTDQQMEEIYSAIRRRPDGRSLGPVHDFLVQVAALSLGMHVLSQAEFEAIFGQLARSTRRWQERPVSRNYVAYLRSILS